MATRILGVDLGAYSVKVILATPGFRQTIVTDLIERPVPPATPAEDGSGGEPHLVRAARVLGQIAREHRLEGDAAHVVVPGDQMFVHILEMTFRTLRRPLLEKAVGAELEGILPLDLEDMVYAFEPIPDDAGDVAGAAYAPGPTSGRPGSALADDDEPTNVQGTAPATAEGTAHGRVAAPTEGMRVLACAMETARARSLLDAMEEHAVEPRGLVAAPGAYARLAESLAESSPQSLAGDAGAAGAPVAIIDIGHERTDVCVVVGGRATYARTILRGGRHVTESIARAWNIPLEQAEQAKHTNGFVSSAAEPARTVEWQRMHEVVIHEVTALASELRRTLQSCRAKTGIGVRRAVLIGGGSRLRGLAPLLSERLRVPVRTLGAADARAILGDQLATAGAPVDVACLAAGVAMEGASGRPRFDLRQGELAYKADLSFLRQKAPALAVALLAILAFAAIEAYASLYKLRIAEENLQSRLAVETTELFGAPLSASDTLDRVQGKVAGQKSPLPRMTAYDILIEMNGKLPDNGKVTVDVEGLEIAPGKIAFRATTATSAQIDEIEEAFKSIDCFDDISRGNTTIGSGGEREFSFAIKSSCM